MQKPLITMSRIDRNTESIAHNSIETNNNVTKLLKTNESKLSIIISIIALFFTISDTGSGHETEKSTRMAPKGFICAYRCL